VKEKGMSLLKRCFKYSIVVGCMLIFLLTNTTKIYAATKPALTVKSVSDVTTSDATINLSISNPSKLKVTQVGYYLYDKNGKQLDKGYDKVSLTNKTITSNFKMSKYYKSLNDNTTYKYKFYVKISSGKTYYSAVKSFTTKKKVTLTVNDVTNLTSSDATLNLKISNPSKLKVTQVGYYLYDKNGNQLHKGYDKVSLTSKTITSSFKMSKYYKSLTDNTTYKYKLYVKVSSGKTYSTDVKSFTTKKKATSSTTSKKVTLTVNNVTGLSSKDATLNVKISNPSKLKVTQVGFYLYDKNGKQLCKKYDKVSLTNKTITSSFKVSKYYKSLTPNTKYKYKFYVKTSDGKIYSTAVKSFTTQKKTYYTDKVNAFLKDSRFDNKSAWSAGKTPILSKWESWGCCAYVMDYIKYVWGMDERGNDTFTSTSKIKDGDVLYITKGSSEHWIVVVKRDGNKLYTAEGNVNIDDKRQVRVSKYGVYSIKNGKIYDCKIDKIWNLSKGYHMQ